MKKIKKPLVSEKRFGCFETRKGRFLLSGFAAAAVSYTIDLAPMEAREDAQVFY